MSDQHDAQFTVIGNHLAQHPDLSLVAIGLAAHIQSLPQGSPVGIKALAAKFEEGEVRIGKALRELEAAGYLERLKVRLPSGRIVTQTISYNKPKSEMSAEALATVPALFRLAGAQPAAKPARKSRTTVTPRPRTAARPTPATAAHDTPDDPDPDPAPARIAEDPHPHAPHPQVPYAQPDLGPHDAREQVTAARLLIELRTLNSRLLLTEQDVRRLTPAVVAWLDRGVTPAAVQTALVRGLPSEPLRHPAAFLAHRLTVDLPPPAPTPAPAPAVPAWRPVRLQNCDGCERAFRSPRPGRCRDCRSDGPGDRDQRYERQVA